MINQSINQSINDIRLMPEIGRHVAQASSFHVLFSFHRAVLRRARLCHSKSSVRP